MPLDISPYTMVSPARIESVRHHIRRIIAEDIPGVFVECGVWRGGVVMAMAQQLLSLGVTDREIWLYDTYEGLPEPTTEDGQQAASQWQPGWCGSALNEVVHNCSLTGYPNEYFRFIAGKVEDTLPTEIPSSNIALLRLDTDWYSSTLHELEHLYPRITPNGALLIDDYGHWEGCRKAVDEYFFTHPPRPNFQHDDYTGISAIVL